MANVALKAHYDGSHLVLDEPHELPQDTPLRIFVIPDAEIEKERAELLEFSYASLERAYGPDEPEYTLDDVIRQ